MGGDDAPSNLVELTGEEHYVAHQLLVKMYPKHAGLAYAAIRMSQQAVGHRAYAWLRRRYAQHLRLTPKSPGHLAKIRIALTGKPKSPEHRAKMAARSRVLAQSPEWREKISSSQLGKVLTAVHREKVSHSLFGNKRSLGYVHSQEFRQQCSRRMLGNTRTRGAKLSPETRLKMSLSKRGKPKTKEHVGKVAAANRGKRRSPELRQRLSEIQKRLAKNRAYSPEWRAKMGAISRAYWAQRKATAPRSTPAVPLSSPGA